MKSLVDYYENDGESNILFRYVIFYVRTRFTLFKAPQFLLLGKLYARSQLDFFYIKKLINLELCKK